MSGTTATILTNVSWLARVRRNYVPQFRAPNLRPSTILFSETKSLSKPRPKYQLCRSVTRRGAHRSEVPRIWVTAGVKKTPRSQSAAMRALLCGLFRRTR
jgi:hypothetical protein